jgi:hypothetical protein
MPEWLRFGGASCVARSVNTTELPRFAPSDFDGGPAEMPLSSTIVFHSPQLSQRPDHLL